MLSSRLGISSSLMARREPRGQCDLRSAVCHRFSESGRSVCSYLEKNLHEDGNGETRCLCGYRFPRILLVTFSFTCKRHCRSVDESRNRFRERRVKAPIIFSRSNYRPRRQIAAERSGNRSKICDRINRSARTRTAAARRAPLNQHRLDLTRLSRSRSIICSEIYEFARSRQRGLLRTGLEDQPDFPSTRSAMRLRRVHLSRTRAIMRAQESLFALLIVGSRTISQ